MSIEIENDTVIIKSGNFSYGDEYVPNMELLEVYALSSLGTVVVPGERELWKSEYKDGIMKCHDNDLAEYVTRSPLGKELLAVRKRIEEKGNADLDWEGVITEFEVRRGETAVEE